MIDNKKTFENVSQRVLFAYKFAYSDFAPITSELASEESQKTLHTLMGDIQNMIYHDPMLLGLPTDQDRAYPWHLSNNQVPELNKIYMSVFKTLYDFYRFLFIVSINGELSENSICITKEQLKSEKVTYKPVYQKTLSTIGIEVSADQEKITFYYKDKQNLFGALKLLGSKNQRVFDKYKTNLNSNIYHNLFSFAACCFDGNLDYLLKRMDEMVHLNGLLLELKNDCVHKRYTFDNRVQLSPTGFDMNIVMNNRVGGFSILYNPRKEQKVGFGTINGIGEKAMLDDFEHLDDDMKEHFINICKPCNGCLTCTKGGKNKIFTVSIIYNGNHHSLCPMFPNHWWETPDQSLVDRLMKYHDLQERYAK